MHDRQWEQCWDCAASRQDTGVTEVNTLIRTDEDREQTLTALIQETRSAELMLLHSFLCLGLRQSPLTEVNKRAETSVTRRRERKAILERGTGERRGGIEATVLAQWKGGLYSEDRALNASSQSVRASGLRSPGNLPNSRTKGKICGVIGKHRRRCDEYDRQAWKLTEREEVYRRGLRLDTGNLGSQQKGKTSGVARREEQGQGVGGPNWRSLQPLPGSVMTVTAAHFEEAQMDFHLRTPTKRWPMELEGALIGAPSTTSGSIVDSFCHGNMRFTQKAP